MYLSRDTSQLTFVLFSVYTKKVIQILTESVEVIFDKTPISLSWAKKQYVVQEVGLHHRYRDGVVLHHVYSVQADDLFFRLNLNTDSMLWKLEEVSDGLPD